MRTNPCPLSFCPPLRRLQQEHEVLQQHLLSILQAGDHISLQVSYEEDLLPLRRQVKAFSQALFAHFHREETLLYPLLAKQLQTKYGPIAVIEFEHEQIRFHLRTFLAHTEQMAGQLPRAEVKSLLYHLTEACDIMAGHFEKEESLLYPLAEKLLDTQDKHSLAKTMDVS
ncbi:hemerythrin domain-containing protein [Ectobacillus ponti]|uniref:Hemerythrin domain-containing protein n=1 Tax=Ectobacillus ponti TaxID=2961894 RepID=A0AA41X8Q5_9BACI|nr:hemerythrin domain-containing protein [Ectobacillus ponti]MCP8969183.1 hemerythrin domain-containing protein [Ectobacillus ponti]